MAKGTAKKTYDKNYWALFLLILAGIVLGGFFGNIIATSVPFLSWLGYGQSFGLTSPIVLDIGMVVLTFGISIKVSIASIVGVFVAIWVYRVL